MYMKSSFSKIKTSISPKVKQMRQCKWCSESFSFAFQLRKHLRFHLLKLPSAFVLDMKKSACSDKQTTEAEILTDISTENNSPVDDSGDSQSDMESLYTEFPTLNRLNNNLVSLRKSDTNRLIKQMVENACVSYVPAARVVPEIYYTETVLDTCTADARCKSPVDFHCYDNTVGVAQRYNHKTKKGIHKDREGKSYQSMFLTNSLSMQDSSSFNGRSETSKNTSAEQILSVGDAMADLKQDDTQSIENWSTKQLQHHHAFIPNGQDSMMHLKPSFNIICKISRKYLETPVLPDISEMTQDFANKLSVKDTLENQSDKDNNSLEVDFSEEILNQGLFCDCEVTQSSNTSQLKMQDVSVECVESSNENHTFMSLESTDSETSFQKQNTFLCHSSLTRKSSLSIHLQSHQQKIKSSKFQPYNIARHMNTKFQTSNMHSETESSSEDECLATKEVLWSNDKHPDKENTLNTRCYPNKEEVTATPKTILGLKPSYVDRTVKIKQKLNHYTDQRLQTSDPLQVMKMPLNSECSTEDMLEAEEISRPGTSKDSLRHNSKWNERKSTRQMVNSRTIKLKKCKERIAVKTSLKTKLDNSKLTTAKETKYTLNRANKASGITAGICIVEEEKLKTGSSSKDFKSKCQTKTNKVILPGGSGAACSDSESILQVEHSKELVLIDCQTPNNTKKRHSGVLKEKPLETSSQCMKKQSTTKSATGQNVYIQMCKIIEDSVIKDHSNQINGSIPNNTTVFQSKEKAVVKEPKLPVISCKYCHKNINRGNIIRHMKFNCPSITKTDRQVKCHICLKNLWSKYIKKHYSCVHHIDNDITQISCDICGEMGFESFETLDQHWKQHRLKLKDITLSVKKGDDKFPCCGNLCLVCKTEMLTENNIRFHMMDHFGNGDFNKESNCPVCLKPISRNVSVDLHVLSHLKVRLFVCLKCNKRFVRYESLQKHAKIHRTYTL